MYGNEQVSRQHVVQAAQFAKLNMAKDVLNKWLAACDPINRGIYSIPKLVKFLEKSRPNVISRVKTSKPKIKEQKVDVSHQISKNDKPENTKELAESPEPQNLQDINYLKQALVRSHQEVPGKNLVLIGERSEPIP